jgi:hypothetical protein
MLTPNPTYSSRPVGPEKRFDQWMTWGNASPDLATGRCTFGYRDNAWDIGVTASRQRAPDQPRKLRQPPSDPAKPDLDDLTDINGGLAIRQTLREPSPGSQRQFPSLGRTATREI